MDADGSNIEVLLSVSCNPSRVGMGLAWSPNRSKIAIDYHVIDVVNNDIYVIDVPAMDEDEGGEIKLPTVTAPLTSEVHQTPYNLTEEIIVMKKRVHSEIQAAEMAVPVSKSREAYNYENGPDHFRASL